MASKTVNTVGLKKKFHLILLLLGQESLGATALCMGIA